MRAVTELACLLALLGVAYSATQHGSAQAHASAHLAIMKGRRMQAAMTRDTPSGRKLLQQGTPGVYNSNSAPPGSVTGSGLLIYTPKNCSALDADDFAQFVYDAYNRNRDKGVYLTAGNYRVTTVYPWKAWALQFACYDNPNRNTPFEINMNGTVLNLGDQTKGGVSFDTCRNVLFRGASITYASDQQVFTQGTITSIGQDTWTLQIDPGYPLDQPNVFSAQQGHLGVLYDPSPYIVKQNGSDFYTEFTSIGNGSYSFPAQGNPNVYVGQKIAIRGDTPAQHVVFINAGYNMRITDTNVWSSNIFAIFEVYSYNSTYTRINVVPDPTPRGRPAPIFSANADGIHSVHPSYGPQITNCNILNTGDDSIAVHGVYYVVTQVNRTGNAAQRNITVASWNCGDISCLDIKVGTRMLMYTNQYQNLGYATIKSIQNVPQPQGVTGQSINYPLFNYNQAVYFAITVTSWPSNWTTLAGFESVVTNPLLDGQFANIINNTLGNNRARGIYHKGSSSIIQNNNVTGPTAVGIFLAPDFYFVEANFNANMTIRSNYVNTTNVGIFVSALNGSLQAPIYQDHQAISILNNTIQGAYHPLIVGSAISVVAQQNTIIDGACYPYVWGDIFNQQGAGSLVYISYTNSSTFSRNFFTTRSSACLAYGNYNSPYTRGPGLTNVVTQ